MKKPKLLHEDIAIKKATNIGMLTFLILITILLVVSLFITSELATQVEVITGRPFAVNGYLSDLRTNMALMQLRTERLQSHNTPADALIVQQALEELYVDTEDLLTKIEGLYLGPDEDIDTLWQNYYDIQKAQNLFLEFSRLPTSYASDISDYEDRYLLPLYILFEDNTQHVITTVNNNLQRIFTTAESLSSFFKVWSLIIMVAMIGCMILFHSAITKIGQRLYDKTQQFEMISNTVDETFLIFNKESPSCEFVSGSAERILGHPANSLQQNRMLIYEHINDEAADSIKKAVYSEDADDLDLTVEYHHPNYTQSRWLQICSYHLGNDDPRFIFTITDRTEERLAAQALGDALVSAQNANNAKKDFLSRMSHEIRTPMNAIIGMTTIAAASIDNPHQVESCLEKITYSSKHLLMLINDVLDMSRIDSNHVKLNNETFDLYQFLSGFISIVYPQASSKGLDFEEKVTGFSEHTTYLGDSFRLNQILLNIVSNAIKFTPEGGKITLTVMRLPYKSQQQWIRFIVSDTGIGMDENALERLYNPFEQADPSIAQKYGGTGLGMSITQNLVALMGGHIDVESAPGEGTTFTVELPFERSNVDLNPVHSQGIDVLEDLSVLVVDDDLDICEHAALLLERMKVRSEWVLSGMEAVERVVSAKAAGDDFDLCLIDYKMPEMDGIETTRRIREKVGPHTPIIIISAYDCSEIEEEARMAGVNAFIAKPLFQSSLYNLLVNVTNGAFGTSPMQNRFSNSLKGKRILLAEDNSLNMEILTTLLNMNGAEVECAENGQVAITIFHQHEPRYFDAILMDVQMPVMDGCEATRTIRASERSDAATIPIIAITANAFANDVSTVLAAGMDAHISKPINIQQLCESLNQLCARNTN